MGFCGRILVKYNGSKALTADLNGYMGTYEYVGRRRYSNCTNDCSGVFMLKGESRVSMIRMAGRWEPDDDYNSKGWHGKVIERSLIHSYMKSY